MTLLQEIATTDVEIAGPGALPSFLGLSMRDALVRAHADGLGGARRGLGLRHRAGPAAGRRAGRPPRHPPLWLRRVLTL